MGEGGGVGEDKGLGLGLLLKKGSANILLCSYSETLEVPKFRACEPEVCPFLFRGTGGEGGWGWGRQGFGVCFFGGLRGFRLPSSGSRGGFGSGGVCYGPAGKALKPNKSTYRYLEFRV